MEKQRKMHRDRIERREMRLLQQDLDRIGDEGIEERARALIANGQPHMAEALRRSVQDIRNGDAAGATIRLLIGEALDAGILHLNEEKNEHGEETFHVDPDLYAAYLERMKDNSD